MFCYQCEQTDRSGEQVGCHSSRGNCGKDEGTAALQDLLVYVCCGIGQYARRARELGSADSTFADFAAGALFTTLTNVNFNATRFVLLLAEADQVRERARNHYEQAARERGLEPDQLSGPATVELANDMEGLVAQGALVGVDTGMDVLGADIVGLRNLNLYGLKGLCAYTHHATVLGHRSEAVDRGIEAALDFLADPPTELEPLLEHALGLGHLNLEVMELLDAANTGSFGHPTPVEVRVTPVAGKAILVSGHDLGDLRTILELTAGSGVNVYTHGELLPAHGYPELRKHAHLVGHQGGAWQGQHADFAAFPGAIVMTSNCLIEPQPGYKQRVFTTGPAGWPGVRHLTLANLAPVLKAAKALPGFAEDEPARTLTIGFARNAVLSVADTVIAAVKGGDISRFLLIGGCDGAAPGRNYYADVADQAADDTVLLTLGCAKYRFNTHEFGSIGGIPRLLDLGQCNDAYSAVKIATALAEEFECSVNELPLSLFVSWFEQKAVAVLLTLLALGIRNIRVGPSVPAFLTPAAVQLLAERFALKLIGDPTEDLANAMAGG
jgi:hydroxylamine reductase